MRDKKEVMILEKLVERGIIVQDIGFTVLSKKLTLPIPLCQANVVNVKTKKLIAHFDIELKGNHKKVTERGIRAKKIRNRIKVRLTSPTQIILVVLS
jgi:hypothetical protein